MGRGSGRRDLPRKRGSPRRHGYKRDQYPDYLAWRPGDRPNFTATEQSDFSSEETEFIEAISNQAALALESARLLDEANKRVEQERAIRDLTTEFSRALDFESLLQNIVEKLGQIPLVKETSIHITPPEEIQLTTSVEQDKDHQGL